MINASAAYPRVKTNATHGDCRYVMTAQGGIWRDKSLEEWPENDFRIFVGDLGQHVTDADLTEVHDVESSLFILLFIRHVEF